MTTSKNPLLSLRALLILMALLTGLTWWVGTQVNRYIVQASISLSDFPGDISQWKFRDNWKSVEVLEGFSMLPEGIMITRTSKEGMSAAEQRLPLPENRPPDARIFASSELHTRAIPDGEKSWHGMLYGVWFYDATGERIEKSGRTVQALRGDTVPQQYSREIPLPANAVEVGISLRLYQNSGTAIMRSPEIQVVSPWAGYNKVILGALLVWTVYGLAVLMVLASHGRLVYALLPIAMVMIIATGVSLPSGELSRITIPLERLVSGAIPDLHKMGLYSFNKIGHAITFALLTFFACMTRKHLGATWLGLACFLVLLAVLSEGMQLFFGSRSTRLIDMTIDLGGAGVGAALFFILWLITRLFKRT